MSSPDLGATIRLLNAVCAVGMPLAKTNLQILQTASNAHIRVVVGRCLESVKIGQTQRKQNGQQNIVLKLKSYIT